jgi:hypothetical protein
MKLVELSDSGWNEIDYRAAMLCLYWERVGVKRCVFFSVTEHFFDLLIFTELVFLVIPHLSNKSQPNDIC